MYKCRSSPLFTCDQKAKKLARDAVLGRGERVVTGKGYGVLGVEF